MTANMTTSVDEGVAIVRAAVSEIEAWVERHPASPSPQHKARQRVADLLEDVRGQVQEVNYPSPTLNSNLHSNPKPIFKKSPNAGRFPRGLFPQVGKTLFAITTASPRVANGTLYHIAQPLYLTFFVCLVSYDSQTLAHNQPNV